MRNNEKGRSMVEMLGVLAIVGVLSVGGIAGYSKAMGKYKNDHLISQMTMLITNIRNLYLTQFDYSTLSEQRLLKLGAVPADMFDHTLAAASGSLSANSVIMHAWNGVIRVFPSKSTNDKFQAFEIYATGINRTTCIELVTIDWGNDPSSGFLGMYIGLDDSDVSAKMQDIVSTADHKEENGIYTTGQHDTAIPLTIQQSQTACSCSPSGCTIGLKYQ